MHSDSGYRLIQDSVAECLNPVICPLKPV